MKGYNLFLGAVTISAGSAGVSPHGSDPAIAYFSSYKQPGCHDVFKGPYITLTQTQDSVCYAFDPPPPIIVQSAYTASIISGCVVYVYTDNNCSANETTLDLGVETCYDEPAGLYSYRAVCGRRYPTPRSTRTSSSLSVSASQM